MPNRFSRDGPIRIGLMTPLTGLVDLYGNEIAMAALMACNDVNARGGVLGRPLELLTIDDGSLPGTALAAAKCLLQQGCVALIGNLLSNSRIAVATEVVDVHCVPYLNFSFYEGSIHSRYFFHFAALPNQQIEPMITALAGKVGPKMYFAGSNYEWPLGSIDQGKKSLLAIGGEVVGEEYPPLGEASIDELLDRVERSGADVFVPYFVGDEQMRLLERFAQRGLKDRMAVVMGHCDEALMSQMEPGVRAGFYSCNTYYMSVDNPVNKQMLEVLAAQPGIDALWPEGRGILTHFGEGAWLCVQAFAQAANRAGTVETRELVRALEQVELSAPQGRVRMDPVTHHAAVNSYLARSRSDGSFEILRHFGCLEPVIPDRYRMLFQSGAGHEPDPDLDEAADMPPLMTDELEGGGQDPGTGGRGAQDALGVTAAVQVLSIADVAVISTNEEGLILDANRRACEIFGYEPGELRGRSIHHLVPPSSRSMHAQHVQRFREGTDADRRMGERRSISGYRKDGSLFPAQASISRFHVDDSMIFVVTINDLTERHAQEAAQLWESRHDASTGLPNQLLLRDRIVSALRRSQGSGHKVGLLLIELDGLKQIEDMLGHATVDELLRALSQRLISSSHPGDTVAYTARWQFAILNDRARSQTELEQLADRLVRLLREPLPLAGGQAFVTTNIGLALGTGDMIDGMELLRQAGSALDAARAEGPDSWRVYDASMFAQLQLRRELSNELRSAIDNHELQLRFQPILSSDSLLVCGGEALLRWFPSRGEISPGAFIPIAEANGLIRPIGRWVIREACRAEVEWRTRFGSEAPYVSLNLSARQLDELKLVDDFRAILRETGADPTRLLLEVTETSLMHDNVASIDILTRLADLGPRIAVDDFGTGYSSLVQLLRLPISTLKIDRAFIDGLGQRQQSRAIVSAVCGMARSMGLKTVAEGVENQEQLDYVRDVGGDSVQGFYLHRPLESGAFIDAVEGRATRNHGVVNRELHQALYVSLAGQDLNEGELETMLVRAREFNRSQGITGFLLSYNGSFLQLIEGRRERLHALLAKISADPRHHQFRLVYEGPIERRRLRDWSMGYLAVDEHLVSPDVRDALSRRRTFLDLAQDPALCLAIVSAFGD